MLNHRRFARCSRLWIVLGLIGFCCAISGYGQEVDFARDVQPILAKRCVACHGPSKSEGGLRLTNQDSVLSLLDSGARAVVVGRPTDSEMIRRISAEDDAERMPPEGAPLTAAQISILTRWVEQGAVWKEHWGFSRPIRHEPPTPTRLGDWVRNEIDQFVLNRLLARDVAPAAPADDAILIRRAYYDLTGLPPTPEEVQAYVADQHPEKYLRLVNELLDSPHFGEHWARHWLDLVRFAETNSYERDGPKPNAWRYRDYVIRSFNNDLPFDKFIIEQLAGDELGHATADQVTATGYYRLGIWDDEPVDAEQARYDGLDDIVSTTGQTFLGLTINCARCHDHKIDPIGQSDYYGLLAFFHNVTPHSNAPERILRPIFANDEARQEYELAVRDLERQRQDLRTAIANLEEEYLAASLSGSPAATTRDMDDLRFAFYRSAWDRLPEFADIKPEEQGSLPDGLFDLAPASRHEDFGFVFSGTLQVPQTGTYTFELDADDGARLSINGTTIIDYDGMHPLGAGKQAKTMLNAGPLPIRLEYFQRGGSHGLVVAWSGPPFERRLLSAASHRERTRPTDVAAAIEKNGREILGDDRFARYRRLQRDVKELKKRSVPVDQALCVTEFGSTAPETFILTRGSPRAPADRVEPHVPAILGGMPLELPEVLAESPTSGRRLSIARWIASADNPQTSRVMVNRVWHHLFGRGIVRSTSNFGIMGTPPTHPELLDWLAIQFVEDGWSIKSLIRRIMLSNTYRMSSQGNDKALLADPQNDLFWRQNMRRLTAEEIRDSMLAVGGTLNRAVYGPSVYPVIPPEVLAGQSQPGSGWGRSTPEEQARRSVYVYVKRSLRLPMLESFDAAETDVSCPERFETTQPTQALGLLNGDFSNEQAAKLAYRLTSEHGTHRAEQVRRGLWLVTQRAPAEAEVERGARLIGDLIDHERLDEPRALHTFCLMALNMNEFIYLD